jgi:uncharacterized surface protein with fasciclin (FAS1) repeats
MKSLMSLRKYTLLIAALFFASITISSCDEDEAAGPVVFEGTIAELINDAKYKQAVNGDPLKSFDSLYKYLTVYPDLVAVASGSTDITLFAPNNTAFVNLLATPGFPAKITQISPSIIKGVLSYHVIAGSALKKADLTPTGTGAGINTAFSQPNNCNPAAAAVVQVLKVNADGTLLSGSTNAAIDILTADLIADNGVVHIVESVMIPPSVGATLTPILGRLSATVLLGTDFSYLAALMTYADCGTPSETALASILTGTPTSPTLYTAFLPANAFFTSPTASGGLGFTSPAQAIAALGTPAQVRAIILSHVVPGSFTAAQLVTAITEGEGSATKQAANGMTLRFTGGNFPGTNNPTVFVRDNDCTSGARPVAVADISTNNGVAHAIFGYINDCISIEVGAPTKK